MSLRWLQIRLGSSPHYWETTGKAGRLEKDAQGIRHGDRVSLERFLRSFGGMGSLNDIVLRPRSADDALWELREESYEKAKAAKGIAGSEHQNP